jgi:hypothetical protein
MRSTSTWQRVVALPATFIAASLVALFYLKAYDVYLVPFFSSGTFRLEASALAPLLMVGILELWRYGTQRRLRSA